MVTISLHCHLVNKQDNNKSPITQESKHNRSRPLSLINWLERCYLLAKYSFKNPRYGCKNQALAALSVHHMCDLCCQCLVFKQRSWFFRTSTWFKSLWRDWRVGTTTHHCYHWWTDDTVMRNHAWIFITFYNISSFTAHIQRFLTQIKYSAVFVKIFISQKCVFFPTWLQQHHSSCDVTLVDLHGHLKTTWITR